MKKHKIIFWIATGLIFLTQGLGELIAFQSGLGQMAITNLGYPEYFAYLLLVFKILGVFALILPMVPRRIKEWAYAGFGFDFMSAFISIWVVDGFGAGLVPPAIAIGVLIASYTSYHKLYANPSLAERQVKI